MTIVVPTFAELVHPKRAALLLIDVQAHVQHDTNYVADVPAMIARTAALVKAARAAGVTCIFTRGIETPATNTPVWISRHVTKPHRLGTRADGTPGAEFHPDVRPLPGEPQFTKTRYSSFIGTPLEQIMAERGLDALIITGIATNVCVEITARDAFQRDIWTLVVSDCTAARTADEQYHGIRDVERNWGLVATSDQLIAEWARLPQRAGAAAGA